MPYDVQAARQAGLSDGEIASALAAHVNYDLEGAKKAGVPDQEITNALVKKYNESFPLSGPQQGQQPRMGGMRPTPTMLERAGQVAEEAKNKILLRDPGVDYETGIKDFALRAGFSRMSNDAERENYLKMNVGAGKFGKDRYGRYYIHPEGLAMRGIQSDKPIALDESGTTRYDIADVAGSAPAMAGATGMALTASGLGVLPGIGLTALGAAGGSAIDELIKRAQGLNLKGPGEQALQLGGEAAGGAFGEGAARGLIGAGRYAMNPYIRFADPARQAFTQEVVDQGFLPKVFQFQPGGKLLGRFQSMGENVLGDAAAAQNKAAMEANIAGLQAKVGMPQPGTGELLIQGVKNRITALSDFIEQAKLSATKGLEDSLSQIRTTLGSMNPNAGALVQDQIKAARTKFGQDASALYAKVDEAAGGKPIVPTQAVKDQFDELAKNLPTDAAGNKIFPTPELKAFYGKYGDLGQYQTTQQMQQLRTDFRNAADSANLVPGFDKHAAGLLKKSVDQAFEDASQLRLPPEWGT